MRALALFVFVGISGFGWCRIVAGSIAWWRRRRDERRHPTLYGGPWP